MRRPYRRFAVALAAVCGLSACVTGPRLGSVQSDAPVRAEIVATPYFPQADHYCGPSALAMALAQSGQPVADWRKLADEVYVPARQGSLQVEMLAAARRHDRIPFVIGQDLADIVAEISAGRPVVVLQDLSFFGDPVWHYAVVVGFDREREEFFLRSGDRFRLAVPTYRFVRTWRRASAWAFVLLKPGELPVRGAANAHLQAIAAFQNVAQPESAIAAFAAGRQRWPDHEAAWIGLAEGYRVNHNIDAAVTVLQDWLVMRPDSIAASNNLALLWHARGCDATARGALERAKRLAGEKGMYRAQVMDTERIIGTATENRGPDCP